MVRRTKPKITGDDPKYSHTFERYRPVETDMPSDVKIPDKSAQAIEPSRQTQSPPTTPPVKKSKTPDTKPEPRKATATPSKPKAAKARSEPQAKTATAPRSDRQTTLDAAVRVDQGDAMKPLIKKGLEQRDIVMLAGRKATEQFVLSPTFIPKPEADRLPMQDGYHTSKRLDGTILDAMREEHDPLRVRSDPAMVRGQFETLFWDKLDEVIEELSKKYL
ncbi:MAG: hypothetical protein WBC93_10965 [Sulfitobacter sp.]